MPGRRFRPFPFAYHQELELEIETLTNQGQGLARVTLSPAQAAVNGKVTEEENTAPTRWVVMVPFALPGERVRARIFRNQKNYSEADLVEVLRPAPERVEPVCPVFGQCGGCQYQHLAYPAQLQWKRRQVAELLQHMAGLELPVNEVIGSPRAYGYRSKITPHFQKPRHSEVGEIGFLRQGTRAQMVDVPRCAIATPALNEALTAVRAEVQAHPNRYRHGATLLLREDAEGRVITNPRAPMISAAGPLRLEHLAGDFFQNNPFLLPAFVDYIINEAAAGGARFLVDAYGGCGLFGIAGAKRFEKVAGVEISATAVDRANLNAERNGASNVSYMAASAEAIFAGITFPPEETVVIIDPPRAGCSEAFLQQLLTWRPRRVVYVSCNPATQMRDLKHFAAAHYQPVQVQPFDLFPQTKHLECVITLVPQSA